MVWQRIGSLLGPPGPQGPPGPGAETVWLGPEPPEPRGDYVLWIREASPARQPAPEIEVVGAAGAAAATVAIPPHRAGDLIIFAARGAGTTPTVPAGWATIFAAVANTVSLSSGWRIATDGNTPAGTWTNGNPVACIVLRGNGALSIAGSATNNANNATNIAYPALGAIRVNTGSMGVRIGARGTAGTGQLAAPPAAAPHGAWTNEINQPPTGASFLAIHTLANLAADIPAQTVASTGSTPFRAHTIEVRVATPPPLPAVPAGLLRWEDDRWAEVGPRPTVGPTAPPDPEIGDLWVDTS